MNKLPIYKNSLDHLQTYSDAELDELAEEMRLECEVHLGVAREALNSYDEPYEVLVRIRQERKAREILGW